MTSNEMQRAAEFIHDAVATECAPDPLAPMRFATAVARHAERRAKSRRIAGAALACTLVVGAFWASTALQPQVLTYRIDNSSELGTLGSYMSAPPMAPLGLHFSEGSRVVLQPRAKGRVSQTTRRGATMVLEDGRAHAEIKHRDRTDWQVLAGPFVVGVTGTAFDVSFDVDTQTFELRMQSGKVQVTGPELSEPIEVRDRQTLVLSARGGEPAPIAPPTPRAAAITSPPQATECAQCTASPPTADPRGSSAAANRRESGPVEGLSFATLGAKGQHQKIVELAEKQGFDSTIASANRADLLALGNAARFAGRGNLALMAYRAVRQRFARSTEATAAAFFLGRLSEGGNPSQAINWYERYVAEAPSGVWVADALGRRMAILHESKPGPSAQAAAQEYLNRFPTGPYAGFARKILPP